MEQKLFNLIETNPIIAAVKSDDGLDKCCLIEEVKMVFILYGDVCNIASHVESVKQAGKVAMVHIDLISGLSGKEVAVDFIKTHTKADGIISTKPLLLKRAKELGLYTALRVFVLDSMAFDNIEKQTALARPNILEILPGLMPKVITKVCNTVRLPVIAGGLISDKEDVMQALRAGAIAVSTTNFKVWLM